MRLYVPTLITRPIQRVPSSPLKKGMAIRGHAIISDASNTDLDETWHFSKVAWTDRALATWLKRGPAMLNWRMQALDISASGDCAVIQLDREESREILRADQIGRGAWMAWRRGDRRMSECCPRHAYQAAFLLATQVPVESVDVQMRRGLREGAAHDILCAGPGARPAGPSESEHA